MYRLEFTKQADKALRRLPRDAAKLIVGKLEILAADPYAPNNNVKKLVERTGYRLRVGDWRVIYEIEDDRLVILVVAVGSRGAIYR
jgi:mRNA interferase RelE/StbE